MANKYDTMVSSIVGLVGGKENIRSFAHCVTRLRFNVKDKGMVNVPEIEKLPGAVGVQWAGNQLQVIIGQDVGTVYDRICKEAELEEQESVSENLDAPKAKKTFGTYVNAFFDAISGCIIPLIPMLMGAGMIKIIIMLLNMAGWLASDNSTYTVLNFAADAAFYFLPIFVGGMAAKKFKATPVLGMFLGAILVHPTFISSVSEGTSLTIFGLPIYAASYKSDFIGTILAVFVMSYVERFFRKWIPDFIKTIAVPACTLLVMIPLTFCAFAPLGKIIGNWLANGMIWLYGVTGFFGIALLAVLRPFLVMTGMHTAITPYLLNAMATVGYEPFYSPACTVANLNQGISCLAVAIKSKRSDVKSLAASSGFTAVIGGITEPAMYGINLRYKTPMIAACIGSFVGAAYLGLTHVYMHSFTGAGGIFSIVMYISEDPWSIINAIIGLVIGAVVTFVATLFLYKDPVEEKM